MAISKNDLKEFSSLKRKSKRSELGLFLVEGIKNCEELLASDYEVEAVLATNNSLHKFPNAINISSKDAARISQLKSPSPVMAIAKIPKNENSLNESNVIYFLESTNDPGNLGTIIRTLDWFGINQLACSIDTVDVYNSKTVMASMGSVFRTNVVYMDFTQLQSQFENHKIIATTIDGNNIYEFKIPEKSVIVFGNESKGVSKEILKHSFDQISIPRFGKAESLNVSTSVAVITNELVKSTFKG